MNGTFDTFERLVISLESAERKDMLRKLAELSELSEAESNLSAESKRLPGQDRISPEAQLLEQPVWVRFWYTMRAFLSSSSPTRAYADHLVRVLGRDLSRVCGDMIEPRTRTYSSGFQVKLGELRRSQAFFRSLLTAYENDKGGFYLILGSLLMKDCDAELVKASDPFAVPFQEDPGRDLRVSITRSMEKAFMSISEQERLRMYQSAQAIEWLKTFCDLAFDRMIARFGFVGSGKDGCLVDSIAEDVRALANILAGGKRVPVLLLESLFLFSIQPRLGEDKFDIDRECRSFVDSATAHLTTIRRFKSTVPVAGFVRFTLRDVAWSPSPVEGGEDWFGYYKLAWKKRFDGRWTEWSRLHRKAMMEKRILTMLDLPELPSLLYHPWEGMWLPLSLSRELTIAFLKGVFRKLYPAVIMKPLKVLLIEGDFYRRENLVEYTDAFSTLEHQQQVLDTFETRLSPKGDIGEGFELIQREKIATVKGKARLENLMLSIESEAEMIAGRVISAFRSMDAILGGVLNVVRGGPYETLINLASIQGKQNDKFRKDLAGVRQLMRDIIEILEEIQRIEKE
ncbi:DUF5312 domain-containing protein [Treponema zuelzerae]|uniref:DUF5312 domain-containing protein n=1 Tax=Teretinema zuelzerae TaxID=156 RepID=A0AAE3JII1_9SPIR|nr:DUF5312 family protein [Teretinema zuelzerae]MCD1655227.1 DUF5312 domain-containing protein [Teretinema zuelzerae]